MLNLTCLLATLLAADPEPPPVDAPAAPDAPDEPDVLDEPDVEDAAPVVVFVHGLYVNASCWDDWRERFEARGFRTLAPEWPGHEGEAAALRADPPAALDTLQFEEVLDQHREVLSTLAEPPLLVGHSLGGLIVQLLLQDGLGRAGVAIDPAPPKGLSVLRLSFFKANLPLLRQDGAVTQTPKQFHYAFTNHLDPDASLALYEQHLVPEASGVIHGPLSDAAAVDYDKARPPLMIVAGGADHIIPQALNQKNARRYGEAAPTTFQAYPGRTHWTLAQEGWEAVADDVLAWAEAL
ncbi:MAG: alpha/beta fold hydrolase [Alphaproteobacteria bacterium]|nr:alpha/beta fold hydrolase [Alphaproteobacteria bacterium]